MEAWMVEISRRTFIEGTGVGLAYAATVNPVSTMANPAELAAKSTAIRFTVNGKELSLTVEDRTTLLDTLRNQVGLTGTKKGCDRGECGACTVHVDGRRIVSCMALAVMQDGRAITTIEGIARGDALHPVQQAFVDHDGFQCGFCTSGQIMSGVALLDEVRSGWPSAATKDVSQAFSSAQLTPSEIRERLSGNLCRCACYPNIVDAVADAAQRT
jgi:xanthine dehydrogenase YagT iron-sulfur-binding subunit